MTVEVIGRQRIYCPFCFERIYAPEDAHFCDRKRLIGARQIEITISDTDGFVVSEGDRYIDKLGWGEMLEVVISITNSGLNRVPYGPMMTAKQWRKREEAWRKG